MKKTDKIFGVWQDDGDCKYWNLYSSIEEAVNSENGEVEIFELTQKLIGTYKTEIRLVRTKKKASKNG